MNKYRFEGNTGFIDISNKNGNFSIVFDKDDYRRIKNIPWYIRKDKHTKDLYYASGVIGYGCNLNGERLSFNVPMHRLIMSFPENTPIDHKNHNGLDNRKENLRETTNSHNNANTRRAGKSGARGVFFKDGAYEARIKINKKQVYLGRHKTLNEAAKKYNEAAFFYHGEHATLNQVF